MKKSQFVRAFSSKAKLLQFQAKSQWRSEPSKESCMILYALSSHILEPPRLGYLSTMMWAEGCIAVSLTRQCSGTMTISFPLLHPAVFALLL